MKAYFYFTQHARVLITIRGSILVMAMESSQKILLLGLVIISLESSTAWSHPPPQKKKSEKKNATDIFLAVIRGKFQLGQSYHEKLKRNKLWGKFGALLLGHRFAW